MHLAHAPIPRRGVTPHHVSVRKRGAGFTLIEVLVVAAIIVILGSIILVSTNEVRKRSRDARRKADLLQLQLAIQSYRSDNGKYPDNGGGWWGFSACGGGKARSGPDGYVPNLAPTYIAILPIDPKDSGISCSNYWYRSDPGGTRYKVLDQYNYEGTYPAAGEDFYDPMRPTSAISLCSDNIACTTF